MEKIQSNNIINRMMNEKRYFFAASLVLLAFISACSAAPDIPNPPGSPMQPLNPDIDPNRYIDDQLNGNGPQFYGDPSTPFTPTTPTVRFEETGRSQSAFESRQGTPMQRSQSVDPRRQGNFRSPSPAQPYFQQDPKQGTPMQPYWQQDPRQGIPMQPYGDQRSQSVDPRGQGNFRSPSPAQPYFQQDPKQGTPMQPYWQQDPKQGTPLPRPESRGSQQYPRESLEYIDPKEQNYRAPSPYRQQSPPISRSWSRDPRYDEDQQYRRDSRTPSPLPQYRQQYQPQYRPDYDPKNDGYPRRRNSQQPGFFDTAIQETGRMLNTGVDLSRQAVDYATNLAGRLIPTPANVQPPRSRERRRYDSLDSRDSRDSRSSRGSRPRPTSFLGNVICNIGDGIASVADGFGNGLRHLFNFGNLFGGRSDDDDDY